MSDIDLYIDAAPIRMEVSGAQGPEGTPGTTDWNELTGTVDVVPFTTTNGGPVNKGELAWTQEDETLSLALNYGTILQLGEETLYHVDNETGTNIANGTPVMYAGTVGNSGRMRVKPWDGTDPMAYMGVATSAIATGASGYVAHFGKVRGIQTNGANYGEMWVNGDIIYTKTGSAGLTKTKPTSGNYAVVAAVISAHASNGTLFVRRSVERNIVSSDIGDATNLATPNTVARRDSSGICSFTAIRLPSGSNAGTFSVGAPLSGNFSYTAPNASGVIALTGRTDGVPDAIIPANAATTRTALGAVGLTGNETIAGNKTLTGQLELSASQAATTPESAMSRALVDARTIISALGSNFVVNNNAAYNATSMVLSLTPGWWEINGYFRDQGIAAAGGKLWLAFNGSGSNPAPWEHRIPCLSVNVGSTNPFYALSTPEYGSGVNPYLWSRAVPSSAGATWHIGPMVTYIPANTTITVGYSQNVATLGDSFLYGGISRIWAKRLSY